MNIRLNKIKMVPVRYYSRLLNNHPDGIDLTMGEGHFNSPFNAKLRAYEALLMNQTKYSTIEGDAVLRKVLVEKYYPLYHKDEIIITNGSTQAVFSVLLSLISSSKDEVIIISPFYPAYVQSVMLLDGTPIIIDSSETNFKINPEVLKRYVTENTKAIIINEPNNPTGVTYSREEKEKLLKFFSNHEFYVIVDEIYRLYTADDYVSFSELIDEKLKKRFIFINGLSKSHLMTGYRVGYALGDKIVIDELRKINYLSVSCISTIMQQAALGALEDDYFPQFVRRYYIDNLKILKENLKELNIAYVENDGGYYLFMNVEQFQMTGEDFCKFFSKEYKVAMVPGILFGDPFKYYVRISCCKDVKEIMEFINILTKYVEEKKLIGNIF